MNTEFEKALDELLGCAYTHSIEVGEARAAVVAEYERVCEELRVFRTSDISLREALRKDKTELAAERQRAEGLHKMLSESLWIDKEPIVKILQDYADENTASRRFVADRIIELLRSAAKLASLDAALEQKP